MLVSRKKLFTILGLLFLLITIPLTVVVLQGNLDPRKKADSSGATFSFDPTSGTIVKDSEVEIKILINTGGRNIVGADSVISFDNTIFSVVDQEKDKTGVQSKGGSFFDKPLILANRTEGNKLYLSINSFTPFKGTSVFGTIKFAAKKTGKVTLKFVDGESKITEQGTAQNLLKKTTSGVFSVEGASGKATIESSGSAKEATPGADLNKDSKVDESDLQLFSKQLGSKGTNLVSDLNKDSQVDTQDVKLFENLYKQGKSR